MAKPNSPLEQSGNSLRPGWQAVCFPLEWKEFKRTTGWEDLRNSTEEIFSEAGLSQYMDPVERRLKDKFANFDRHYMFTYKKEMPLRRPDVSDA